MEGSGDNLLTKLAQEIANQAGDIVTTRLRAEIAVHFRAATEFCLTEEEAAAVLKCSPQTLAAKRKKGEIDSTLNPAGRPVFLRRHLEEFLLRNEKRYGRPHLLRAASQ